MPMCRWRSAFARGIYGEGSGVDRVDVQLGAVDADALARAGHLCHPVTSIAAANLDASLVLRDEHVLLDGGHLLEEYEAFVPVTARGGPGEHLDNDRGIRDGLAQAPAVPVLRASREDGAAYDARVGVGGVLRALHVEERIRRVD